MVKFDCQKQGEGWSSTGLPCIVVFKIKHVRIAIPARLWIHFFAVVITTSVHLDNDILTVSLVWCLAWAVVGGNMGGGFRSGQKGDNHQLGGSCRQRTPSLGQLLLKISPPVRKLWWDASLATHFLFRRCKLMFFLNNRLKNKKLFPTFFYFNPSPTFPSNQCTMQKKRPLFCQLGLPAKASL